MHELRCLKEHSFYTTLDNTELGRISVSAYSLGMAMIDGEDLADDISHVEGLTVVVMVRVVQVRRSSNRNGISLTRRSRLLYRIDLSSMTWENSCSCNQSAPD